MYSWYIQTSSISSTICVSLYVVTCTYMERSKRLSPIYYARTCSTNLLDLFDGPLVLSSSQPTVSGSTPSLQNSAPISPATAGGSILSPQTTSDFSLLDPLPAATKPQLLPSEAQPTLALTLFEKPIGSMRIPQEYASFPLSHGWENKVGGVLSLSLSLSFCVCFFLVG